MSFNVKKFSLNVVLVTIRCCSRCISRFSGWRGGFVLKLAGLRRCNRWSAHDVILGFLWADERIKLHEIISHEAEAHDQRQDEDYLESWDVPACPGSVDGVFGSHVWVGTPVSIFVAKPGMIVRIFTFSRACTQKPWTAICSTRASTNTRMGRGDN